MKTRRVLVLALLTVSAVMSWAGGADEADVAAGSDPFRVAVIMPSATTDTAFSQSMWSALKSVQAEMG